MCDICHSHFEWQQRFEWVLWVLSEWGWLRLLFLSSHLFPSFCWFNLLESSYVIANDGSSERINNSQISRGLMGKLKRSNRFAFNCSCVVLRQSMRSDQRAALVGVRRNGIAKAVCELSDEIDGGCATQWSLQGVRFVLWFKNVVMSELLPGTYWCGIHSWSPPDSLCSFTSPKCGFEKDLKGWREHLVWGLV